MSTQNLLDERMKGYEKEYRTFMPPQDNYILRLDGKAFHTFTRGLEKPFDKRLSYCFSQTILESVKEFQNAVLAYHQSDEVSVVFKNDTKENSESWFNGNVNKINSVASSVFTYHFNQNVKYFLKDKVSIPAIFDCRVFAIDKQEIISYLIWRQRDAIRNSINGLAQHYIGHRKIRGKNTQELKQILLDEFEINFDEQLKLNQQGEAGNIHYKNDEGDWNIRFPFQFTDNRDFIDTLI